MSFLEPVIKPEAVPLLQKALDHIHAHPEEWDQTSWREYITPQGDRQCMVPEKNLPHCGTVGCLAGWLVTLSDEYTDTVYSDSVVNRDGGEETIFDAASILLTGRPYWNDAYTSCDLVELFQSHNTESQLWETANQLCGGKLNLPVDL